MNSIEQTGQGVTEQIQTGTIHHNLSNLMPASSEIGHLWISYLAENISICFLKKWVEQSTDPEIKPLLQQVLDTSTRRVEKMENLFHAVNYPVPRGFGEKDIINNAPNLFSESFTCLYTRMMQKMIMHNYISATTSSYRSDFLDFYYDCLRTSEGIHRRATEILLAKGILQKHPSITAPQALETVSSKDYFGSFINVFGDKRTLNALEISHIYTMMEIKLLIRTLNTGYSQVVQSEQIRDYLIKSIKLADKQLESLGRLLTEQDITRPSISEILITDATESSFSDRLILTHSTAVDAYITTGYGLAAADLYRKDLIATFLKFAAEVLDLAKDGAELMIELGWLERMPETADRKKLAH